MGHLPAGRRSARQTEAALPGPLRRAVASGSRRTVAACPIDDAAALDQSGRHSRLSGLAFECTRCRLWRAESTGRVQTDLTITSFFSNAARLSCKQLLSESVDLRSRGSAWRF